MQETQVPSLSQEDILEKEITTHSSILAWEIPWTEEPGGYQYRLASTRRQPASSLPRSGHWAPNLGPK